jgi:hypothetical protein
MTEAIKTSREIDCAIAEKVMKCNDSVNWSPSTNLEHAMEVIELMSTTTKEYWEIHVFSTGFKVSFEYEGGRDVPWKPGEYETIDDDLPTAICKVALMAVDGAA